MSHKPTAEQAAIVDAAATGTDLVIEAGAGAGKTSTLKLVAKELGGKRGVYVAYNRAIAVDAAKSFPNSVTCKTAHSFAYGAVGKDYRARLNGPRVPARETARILGIREPVQLNKDRAPLAPQTLARLVNETIGRFCYSADAQIQPWHVPAVNGVDEPAERRAIAAYLVPIAQRGWDTEIVPVRGRLRFSHDAYLKIFCMSGPQLGADYVLLDEAQDSNPCVASLIAEQQAQKIHVGDSCQAIYGWRGAVDAMKHAPGQRLYLSQSFRFGPAVADEANKWLHLLAAPLRLRGFDPIASQVTDVVDPADAVLCRTNAEAVRRVLAVSEAGQRVALVGGGNDIIQLAEASIELRAGRGTAHPELCAFTTWREVQDYAEQDSGGSDLKVAVGLIDSYGAEQIINILNRLWPEDRAQVVVSTAHKAKGREWPKVQIADDFREPKASDDNPNPTVPREDAMLAYVAVTRAQELLGREGLKWADGWLSADPAVDAEAVDEPEVGAVSAPAVEPVPGQCFRCGSNPCRMCDPAAAASWSALTGNPAGSAASHRLATAGAS